MVTPYALAGAVDGVNGEASASRIGALGVGLLQFGAG